jgi:hypothetical protein
MWQGRNDKDVSGTQQTVHNNAHEWEDKNAEFRWITSCKGTDILGSQLIA